MHSSPQGTGGKCCPTPHGVGGLKSGKMLLSGEYNRPTPHGVGGLKYVNPGKVQVVAPSHPSRGGWIEILRSIGLWWALPVPPLTGWVD